MNGYHIPVMLTEVMEGLGVASGKQYIDATIGGGGHGIEIVKRGGKLLGIDADNEAVAGTRETFRTLLPYAKETVDWILVHGNFRNLKKIAVENGFENVSGVLFDLGVSSHQLDTPDRGFSYRFLESPLDLRMDQSSGKPAYELIRDVSEEELYEIFSRFGEEERARTIAHAIVLARRVAPIRTTGDVVNIVTGAIGQGSKRTATLSRVFQALRIWVNDELRTLREGLSGSWEVLEANGRIAVISFQSLEDRIVKQEFKSVRWEIVSKKPIVASVDEVRLNRRARSAKLRIAKKNVLPI